jgi:HEAT repeat protein
MVVVGLAKLKDPRAVPLLVELLEDEEVAGHAVMALRKMGATPARSSVERFLQDPRAWVRSEAKKAIAKFDKASAKP